MILVIFIAFFIMILVASSLHLDILSAGIIILVGIILFGIFFIGIIVEAQSIGLGTLYGHVYVNMAYSALYSEKIEVNPLYGKTGAAHI